MKITENYGMPSEDGNQQVCEILEEAFDLGKDEHFVMGSLEELAGRGHQFQSANDTHVRDLVRAAFNDHLEGVYVCWRDDLFYNHIDGEPIGGHEATDERWSVSTFCVSDPKHDTRFLAFKDRGVPDSPATWTVLIGRESADPACMHGDDFPHPNDIANWGALVTEDAEDIEAVLRAIFDHQYYDASREYTIRRSGWAMITQTASLISTEGIEAIRENAEEYVEVKRDFTGIGWVTKVEEWKHTPDDETIEITG